MSKRERYYRVEWSENGQAWTADTRLTHYARIARERAGRARNRHPYVQIVRIDYIPGAGITESVFDCWSPDTPGE